MSFADTRADRIRRFFALLLGTILLLGGLAVTWAALRVWLVKGDTEDALAAGFVASMLLIGGISTFVAVRRKQYRDMPPPEVLEAWVEELNEEGRKFRERNRKK